MGLRRLGWLLATAWLASGCTAARAQEPDRRVRELQSLRWGMFICWSFSTLSGTEWTPGVQDASYFRATGCDTDQWARTAKEAGMGYILFLAKHHDGFCLWDTQTTDRKVTRSALGIDVLAKLRASCKRYGIKLALYFSEGDWTWPRAKDGLGGGTGQNPEMQREQLRELCTRYGPIEFFWMDCAAGHPGTTHEEVMAWVKRFQPGCFVGFNGGGGDLRAGEMGRPGRLPEGSPYQIAEFTYPILPPHQGGAMWFYSLPIHDDLCLPAERLYRDYAAGVKHGNIFSLDVGPDPAGRLRKVDVETLRRVGRMIRKPPKPEAPPVSERKEASASSVWPDPGYEAAMAFDGDESTRWGAAADARSGWLEVDLGRETEIGRAVVMEVGYPRTQQFAIEVEEAGSWRAVVSGEALGGERSFSFAPVRARRVRLSILKASEVPTIEEFCVYPPAANVKR